MNNQPFDLSKMDFDAIRHRLRKRLLVWSTLPVAIILIISIWLVGPFILNKLSITNYYSHNYQSAKNLIDPVAIFSLQKYIFLFNMGTIDSRLGNFNNAENELKQSIAYAPENKVCSIEQNLALTEEAHANNFMQNNDPKNAITYYINALTIIGENQSCFTNPNIRKRIEKEKQSAIAAEQLKQGAQGSNNQNNQAPSQSQQQQLEQSNQQAQLQQQQDSQFGTNPPEQNDPNVKPW